MAQLRKLRQQEVKEMSRVKSVSWQSLWVRLLASEPRPMNRLMLGYHLPDARPVEESGTIIPWPMMLIHCQTGEEIPVRLREQLAAAASTAETWLIPTCDRAEGYVMVKEEYDQRVSAFFDETLR
jgi:hypothetical protein